MTIEQLARPEIVAMKPYSSARKEAPGQGVLLNANEAPWPLLDPDSGLNRYPDPQPESLRRRLARLYETPEENLLITRGSDEGIDLLTRVFCRAGEDAILQAPPAFGMYRIAAQTQGAAVVSVPRDADDFALDEQGMLDAFEDDRRIKLVFLTSPSNPTGAAYSRAELKALTDVRLVAVDGPGDDLDAGVVLSDVMDQLRRLRPVLDGDDQHPDLVAVPGQHHPVFSVGIHDPVHIAMHVRMHVVGVAVIGGTDADHRLELRRLHDAVTNPEGTGATAGMIVMAHDGACGWAYTTPYMARGGWTSGGEPWAAI